ncbi:MAG: hypothetical protein DCC75_04545 [Proteobacteria bacterium]|nr:MAG: hypothetical protein DCC75_04545 [Pseudomonadota bacterium]
MRLESALYSGREGLQAHGQALSVIGDNISNSNTVGYKTSRVEFADLFVGGRDGAQSTNIPSGGGGVALSRVRQIFEGGVLGDTGRSLDIGIDGGGFFMVGSTESPFYSRAGNFQIDEEGFLANSEGMRVLGLAPGGTTIGEINMVDLQQSGTPTSAASIVGNLSSTSTTTAAVANPETFSDINQAASFISNLTVYDSLGDSHTVTMAYYKTGTNAWTVQAYIDGADVNGGTEGVPVKLGADLNLQFDGTGVLTAASQAASTITAAPNYANGATAGNFTINLASFSQFATPSSISAVTQNGLGAGNVKSYEIRDNGEIYALRDSGTSQLVATIQLADFNNKDGLERAGNSLFRTGESAGDAATGTPGTSTLGYLRGGTLERSTVDLAGQFIDLVLFQRGYQASSQVLGSTSDMIRDTIALIR